MTKRYCEVVNVWGGESLILPVCQTLIDEGWPVVEYDTWTVRHGEYVIEDVRTEFRGLWGVPIAPTGVCVTVELIRMGAYDKGDQYVSIDRPTQADLHVLNECDWEYDGAFAHRDITT